MLVAAARPRLGERMVAQVVVAHPEHEEVSGLEFLRLFLAVADGLPRGRFWPFRLVRVVAGRLVEVAVASVDIEAREFIDPGERIGESRSHQACDVEIDRGEVLEPAGTLERLEEKCPLDLPATVLAVLLEEIAPAGHRAEAARDPRFEEAEIAELPAIVIALGAGVSIGQRRDETCEDGRSWCLVGGHRKISGLNPQSNLKMPQAHFIAPERLPRVILTPENRCSHLPRTGH